MSALDYKDVLLAAKKFCKNGTKIQMSDWYMKDKVVTANEFYCNFLCIIHDFSEKNDLSTNLSISSPCFKMEGNDSISWYILIYPNGARDENKDYVSIYLCPKFSKPIKTIQAKFSFKLFDKENVLRKSESITKKLFKKDDSGYGYPKFIKKEDLKKYLQNDKLILLCCIKACLVEDFNSKTIKLSDIDNNLATEFALSSKAVLENVSNTWKNLYKDTLFTDCTLIIGKKEIKVHKNVLAAASPVFLEILKKEKASTNSIEITDTNFVAMQEILRFIYINKVDNLLEIAHELIVAAEKYAINDLKKHCEEALCDEISIDNIGKILLTADASNSEILLSKSLTFVIKNRDAFRDYPDIEKIVNSSERLSDRLLWSLRNKIEDQAKNDK